MADGSGDEVPDLRTRQADVRGDGSGDEVAALRTRQADVRGDGSGDEVAALRAQVAELAAQHEALLTSHAALQAKVDALEGDGSVAGAPSSAAVGGSAAGVGDEPAAPVDPTGPSRRDLLRRAGVAAAGAVAGGAALAVGQASPAAAASGTFDGNPALTVTSNAGGPAIDATLSSAGGNVLKAHAVSSTDAAVLVTNGGAGAAIEAHNQYGGGSPSGVEATSITGVAVNGTSQLSVGVKGKGLIGVQAETSASGGPAVLAINPWGGYAVEAKSASNAQLHLDAGYGALPPPTTLSNGHTTGEVYFDSNNDLWVSVKPGTPGTWRRVAGPATAGALVVLAKPVRVYDSRPGNPPATPPKSPLGGGTSRAIDTKGNSSGVPAGATAVLVNLTVVNTSASGFLALYANGIAYPGTSSINWDHAGEIVANTTLTAVDANAVCQAYVPVSSQCDVLLDVVGYYR